MFLLTLREPVNSSIRQAPAGANDLRLSRSSITYCVVETATEELGQKRSPGALQPDIGICGKVARRDLRPRTRRGAPATVSIADYRAPQ